MLRTRLAPLPQLSPNALCHHSLTACLHQFDSICFGLSYLLSVACLQTKFLTFLLYIRYPSHNWAPMLCVITAISPVFTNLILFGLSYFLSVVCLRLVSYKFLHCLVTSLLRYAPIFCSIPCLQQIHFWRLFCILAFPICSIWCIVKNGAIGFY